VLVVQVKTFQGLLCLKEVMIKGLLLNTKISKGYKNERIF